MKTKTSQQPLSTHPLTLPSRPVGLARIFNDCDSMPGGKLEKMIQRRRLSVKMNRDERPCARRDRRSQLPLVHQERVFVCVYKHRHGSVIDNCEYGCVECIGLGDDFVALLNSQNLQGDSQSIGTAVYAEGMTRIDEARECSFEF